MYKIIKSNKLCKSKKVISFSLFTNENNDLRKKKYLDNDIYMLGAIVNIVEAQNIYPGWVCRFYVHTNVPIKEKLLERDDCEVIIIESNIPPMYWRFFVVDDPNIDLCIIRDTDSIVNIKEKNAVDEWINSNYILHTMHDHFHHARVIMGGMWGLKLKDKNINIVKKIYNYCDNKKFNWSYSDDQKFLRDYVFELYKNNVIDHNSNTLPKRLFEHSKCFPESTALKYGTFIGERIIDIPDIYKTYMHIN